MSEENDTWYAEVYHKDKYGFHGNTRIQMLVEEETEDELRGKKANTYGEAFGRLVVRKENIAGFKEYTPWKRPPPSEETLKEWYQRGRIDEEELEERLAEVV